MSYEKNCAVAEKLGLCVMPCDKSDNSTIVVRRSHEFEGVDCGVSYINKN